MGFERAIVSFLKEFSPKDLTYAVAKNMSVADHAKNYTKMFKVYSNYVSPTQLDKALVLTWIMEVNPELATAIKLNNNNYTWFCKQIDEINGGIGHGKAGSIATRAD